MSAKSKPLSWSTWAAILLLTGIGCFALFGPLLIAIDPAAQDLTRTLAPPSWHDPLGADQFGRSTLARLAQAAQVSLLLAVLSVLSAAIPGTLLGLAAAWWGGFVDRALGSLADMLLALPGLLIIVLIISFAPGEFWPIYLGVSLALSVEYFRVVRATARRILGGPQVQASRLLGFGPDYIARRHIAPELAPLIFTLMAFGAATAVLAVAALGYIGIGLNPPTAELGQMMAEYLPYYQAAPWLLGGPILVLMLWVLGLALLAGDRPQ
jgi:peptide/nickel transport system permease protein